MFQRSSGSGSVTHCTKQAPITHQPHVHMPHAVAPAKPVRASSARPFSSASPRGQPPTPRSSSIKTSAVPVSASRSPPNIPTLSFSALLRSPSSRAAPTVSSPSPLPVHPNTLPARMRSPSPLAKLLPCRMRTPPSRSTTTAAATQGMRQPVHALRRTHTLTWTAALGGPASLPQSHALRWTVPAAADTPHSGTADTLRQT